MNEVDGVQAVKKTIIGKLYAHGCWGKGQLLEERLLHGIPKYAQGFVRPAIKELKKEGLIVIKKSGHGVKYYLNKNKRAEIESYLPI